MRGLKGSRTLPRGRLRRRLEARTRYPRGDRPRVKAQRPGGLRDGQALALMAVVDLGKRLVIDHDRLRSLARFNLSRERVRSSRRLMQSIPDLILAGDGSSPLSSAETIPASM